MIGVEIRNFQAIDDLTLKVEGFTALVGRSNIGKSSIVRALRCALSGSSGSDFVRHDARLCPRIVDGAKTCKCFASVKLTFGPGQAVLWEKGGRGMNRYTVWRDGVESVYDRVGQNVDLPEFLDSQFAPVKLGASASLLQVSSQFEAPFLLDLSGPAVAGILSDVGQLDEINQALAAVAKDRRADVATRKVRETDLATLTERLAAYVGLDDHLLRIRTIQEQGCAVEKVEVRRKLVDRLIQEVTEAAQVLRRVSVVADQKPPDVRPLRELSERVHKARDLDASLRERGALIEKLERLTAAPVPVGLERVQKVASALATVGRWLSKLAEHRDVYVKGAHLQSLTLPEAPALGLLARRLSETGRLASKLEALEHDIAQAERELAESSKEATAVLSEFAKLGVCPTCHRGIAPEHVAHV